RLDRPDRRRMAARPVHAAALAPRALAQIRAARAGPGRRREPSPQPIIPMNELHQRVYGQLPDGRPVHEITLSHGGLALSLITLGGIITALRVPDRAGVAANVVRGFD